MSDEQAQAFNTMAADPTEVQQVETRSDLGMVKYLSGPELDKRLKNYRENPLPPEAIVAQQEEEKAAERRRLNASRRSTSILPPEASSIESTELQPIRWVTDLRDRTLREARTFATVISTISDGRGVIDIQRIEAANKLIKDRTGNSKINSSDAINIDQPLVPFPGAAESKKSGPSQVLHPGFIKRFAGKHKQSTLIELVVEEEAEIGAEVMPEDGHFVLRLDDKRWLWMLPLESGGFDTVIYEVGETSVFMHHGGETIMLSPDELGKLRDIAAEYTKNTQKLYATL